MLLSKECKSFLVNLPNPRVIALGIYIYHVLDLFILFLCTSTEIRSALLTIALSRHVSLILSKPSPTLPCYFFFGSLSYNIDTVGSILHFRDNCIILFTWYGWNVHRLLVGVSYRAANECNFKIYDIWTFNLDLCTSQGHCHICHVVILPRALLRPWLR